MVKYSFEFKLQVVNEYLEGHGGYAYLAKKHGIGGAAIVQRWVDAFKTFGQEGLQPSQKKKIYSFEFKLHAVELYLSSNISYRDLAASLKMNNSALLVNWVQKYRAAGPESLRLKKPGSRTDLKKNTNTLTHVPEGIDATAERVRELEEEVLKLRIENAYLKELRRLRLEEEMLLSERRGSSAASEENLD